MTDNSHEQISALMDGELTGDHLYTLHALENNPEYRKIWAHYHLIGEGLRGSLPPHVDMQLADRIRQAIESEPATIPEPENRPFVLADYLKPVLGFAIAASVTVAVIFGVRQAGETPSLDSTPTVAANQQSPTPPAIDSVSQQSPRIVTAPAVTDESQATVRPFITPTDARSRLNRYLVNHNEYRTNTGVQGMLPYVRIVAHEAGE